MHSGGLDLNGLTSGNSVFCVLGRKQSIFSCSETGFCRKTGKAVSAKSSQDLSAAVDGDCEIPTVAYLAPSEKILVEAGRNPRDSGQWKAFAMNSLFSDLPREIIAHILSFVEGSDIVRSAAPTCLEWASISRHNQGIWKARFEIEFGCDSRTSEESRCWRQRYANEWSWRQRKVEPKTLEGLAGHVIGISYVDVEKTILGWSPDGIQKKWNLSTSTCTGTVNAARMISCVDFDEMNAIVGCLDGRIEVWDGTTGKCRQILLGHDSCVVCVKSDGKHILSGSVDNTVRVWDKAGGFCKRVFSGHQDTVLCLASSEGMVVSGSSDRTLRVWNIELGYRELSFEGNPHTVSCVDFEGDTVVSGSHDGSIRVWSISSRKCIGTLIGHEGVVMCVRVRGRRIVSGTSDCFIKVWDIVTGKCVRTLEGHTSYVSCLIFDERRIISGSNDGVIKVWDLCPTYA
ncbi:hypothetical protein BSKO_04215 [Bryopsis sp. KO-2023]|nr:hypothetical protein BSKO_04215 [Bryopsis sp. KO-2023]